MKLTNKILGAASAGIVALALNASANTFTSSGASVDFSLSGNTLTVVLANTSANDVTVPAQVLTAVFFSANNTALTSVSALLTPLSVVINDSQPAGGVVGGEWAYAGGISGPGGASAGISSSGFGLFGAATFPGADLEPPAAVDGLQYGITSAGDNPATENGGTSTPLIKNSVTFTLTVPAGFNLDSINKVSFQYGTALDEPNVPGIPPSGGLPDGGTTVLLLGTALSGLALIRRKVS